MRKNSLLFKVLIAVSLTAMSVVIDSFFKYILHIANFGLPFYAIPLIIGSIILGPVFGGLMALVGDTLGVLMTGDTYLPLFAIAALAWGVIPGLIIGNKYSVAKLSVSVFVSYLVASLANSFALYIYFGINTTLITLGLRLALLPFNAFIIIYITKDLYHRLQVIIPEYLIIKA